MKRSKCLLLSFLLFSAFPIYSEDNAPLESGYEIVENKATLPILNPVLERKDDLLNIVLRFNADADRICFVSGVRNLD